MPEHSEPYLDKDLVDYLSEFISKDLRLQMERILDLRTLCLTVVLEDVFQPHNASAAIRSCESFGIQDIHIIEGKKPYHPNKDIVMGASKWIELHRYGGNCGDQTKVCLERIKSQGYTIVATTPKEDAVPLDQLPVNKNLALCFGSEKNGLSCSALDSAELFTRIPTVGFTQSLNLSVSVAICLYQITGRIRKERMDWKLTSLQRKKILLSWLKKSVRNSHLIERRFLNLTPPITKQHPTDS